MDERPYYDDGQITIYVGDCRDITEWTTADVLVTDPPYGMCFESNARTRSTFAGPIAGDADLDARDAALALWGHTRPALVFGTWRCRPPTGERQRLIWWKRGGGPGMGNLSMPWGTSHEEIYVLGSGWDREVAGVRRSPSVLTTDGRRGSQHGDEARYGHPTPKPIGLMETLLRACPPGCVADPFSGVGATLVAARNLGRRAIGVEIEERYAEVAARRLAQDCLTPGD